MSAPEQQQETAQAPLSRLLERPREIPAAARWSDGDGEWQLSATDAEGRLDGPYRAWRADGSLRTIARHRAGKQVDVGWKFHPDGSLFSVGTFVDGAPRGVHRRYANPDAYAERLQPCCVPAGAWQLQQHFGANGNVDLRWFDRDGARLLDSGAPYPALPAGVPPEAWFNENEQAWEAGVTWIGDGLSGTRRRWSPDGTLRLIENLDGGRRHGRVSWFDETGAPVCDAEYDRGRLTGTFHSHQINEGYFADSSVTAYVGTYAADQAVGAWRLLRTGASEGIARELGAPSSEATLAAVLVDDEKRTPAAWTALAGSLLAAGQVAESLLATARAAAGTGDVVALRAALQQHTLPLRPDSARAAAGELLARVRDDLVALADGLRRGWDASELLVAIAKALPDRDRCALDLATAAALLAPGSDAPLATRALLHGSLGDPAAARRDIEALRATGAEQAAFLDLYLRVYFPAFDFWPARELDGQQMDADAQQPVAEGPISLYRDVNEIREVARRYATRLARLRALLETRMSRPGAVAVPEVTALLVEGPLPLSQWTFTMSAAEYGGDEQASGGEAAGTDIEIAVDETTGLDLDGAQLLRILRRARADWAGLAWLCWAAGMDHVGLPTAVEPPPQLAQQAVLAMQRTWRCRDKMNTSGLLALTKGVPGFAWEGTSIDQVPIALAEVALEEYVERRALFAWLCDPANRSPWQDDLRED